jgi:signal transduction histidine kinase
VPDTALLHAVAHLREGVQVIAPDWTYLYLNDTAARHGRRHVTELLGRSMTACYPGIEQTEAFAVMRRVLQTRQPATLRTEFVYDTGDSAWFDLLIEPVPDGICVLSVDITERRTIDLQFQQAQKMEALGQLAGGVAHDFNNLLTAILGYCDLLLDEAPADDPRRADLEEIKSAAVNAASLTARLLAFSRKQVVEAKLVDLNEIVNDTTRMLQRVVGENIEIDLRLAQRLDRVKADPAQLSQVLTNLVVNARDAMPDGGRLSIETANVDLDESYSNRHFSVTPGPHVMLAVADTGTGMTPAVQARLFEPFFTTKPAGKGTGLGLASIHGIIKQADGNIWVYSEPGRGTTFKIYLPRAGQTATVGPATRPAPAALAGQSTILVVEDNDSLRLLASRSLERYGYSVLSAGTAREAVRVSEAYRGPIHLLLTDVVMPDVSGPELASGLAAARRDMRVLYMSGYTDDTVMRRGMLEGGTAYLQKPFTPQRLAQKVAEVLESVPTS